MTGYAQAIPDNLCSNSGLPGNAQFVFHRKQLYHGNTDSTTEAVKLAEQSAPQVLHRWHFIKKQMNSKTIAKAIQ